MSERKGNYSFNNGAPNDQEEQTQQLLSNGKYSSLDHETHEQTNGDAVNSKAMEAQGIPLVEFRKEKELSEAPAPPDRFRMVYIIFMLHGIGTLMPWNMFITANSYFVDYKLAANDTEVNNLRSYFLSYLGFASQVPNVALNMFSLFCVCGGKGNLNCRVVWSLIVVVVMFIVTVILAMIDSSGWPAAFFWLTMLSVVIINSANGVYQNSIYGLAAVLPMKYTNAVVLGSNISGTLVSVLAIVAIASTPNPRTSAIYYFLAAILVLLVAFDTFFALPLLKFYRFYKEKSSVAPVETDDQEQEQAISLLQHWKRLSYVFKKCWVQHLSVFFVFFVSLTCFPAIQASVRPVGDIGFISEKYFTPVFCFFFFNLFAMLGNVATEFIRFPGPRFAWIPIALRALFIPYLMFCNFRPETRGLPVYLNSDWAFVVASVIMPFTSGYYSSLAMMYAPQCVEGADQGKAGMMAAFFLISGIFIGVIFSFPMTLIVEVLGH